MSRTHPALRAEALEDRLAPAAGDLDPTFGNGGLTTFAFPNGGSEDDGAADIALQSDGKVVLAGPSGPTASTADFAIARLNPDGSPDTTFGQNGLVLVPFDLGTAPNLDDEARAVAIQPDGKIVAVGYSTTSNSFDIAVARFNADGSLDLAYGTNGNVVIPLDLGGTNDDDALAVALRSDGKVVLAGRASVAADTTAFVAAGDVNGDGRAEVVATPDQGGGPNVVIFAWDADGAFTAPSAFFALGNPDFRGGARPAIGDINGDGFADLAVGAGFLGGPNVEIHDGKALAVEDFTTLIGSGFFGFDGPDASRLRNGVFLAIGDVDGDTFADLVVGGGPDGGPRVLILPGKHLAVGDVAGAYGAPVANFFFGNDADRGGVRLATTDADGDARADLVVGSGEDLPSKVRVYVGKDFTSTAEPAVFQDLDPFGATLPDGVFVG